MTIAGRRIAGLAARLACVAAVIVACAKRDAHDKEPPEAPVVRTDVATVERYVSLPGMVATRWVERPLGSADRGTLVPGPTDYVLTAYVEIEPSAWPAIDTTLGGARGATTTRLEESLAELILPPRILDQLARDGDVRLVPTVEYDIRPARRGTRIGDRALRLESGLILSFSTR